MATQTVKQTTTKTVVNDTIKGPTGTSSPATSSMEQLNLSFSPTIILRRLENELVDVKDLLATYMGRAGLNNRQLMVQKEGFIQELTLKLTDATSHFESELAQAFKEFERAAKEKAKAEIDIYKAAANDWKQKYLDKEKDYLALEIDLRSAKSQLIDLQSRHDEAVHQRDHWEGEYKKLKLELAKMEEELEKARKKAEAETAARVDLEYKILGLEQNLALLRQGQHDDLYNRIKVMFNVDDHEYQEQFEAKLRELREFIKYRFRITQEETEMVIKKKLEELQSVADRKDKAVASAREELFRARRRVHELSLQLSEMEAKVVLHEARIKELENLQRREQEAHIYEVEDRDFEIRKLREALELQITGYSEFLEFKALDVEMDVYRQILESQEQLQLPKSSILTQSEIRRRGYVTSSSAKGAVKIHEVDPDGKYIKLLNTSDKDQLLAGWQVKHTADNKVTTYKFETMSLKSNNYTTVWSPDSGGVHTPPADLVMKGQGWQTGDNIKTVLLDHRGEEMAEYEMKRLLGMGGSASKPGRPILESKGPTSPSGIPVPQQGTGIFTGSETSRSGSYAASSSAKGPVKIYETDPEGKYIKLYNTSDRDQPLGGWQIRHTAGNKEATHKFEPMNLRAGHYVTVWSIDGGGTHAPPSDLVMRRQRSWCTGDEMKTVLINNRGEEMAVNEIRRTGTVPGTTPIKSSPPKSPHRESRI